MGRNFVSVHLNVKNLITYKKLLELVLSSCAPAWKWTHNSDELKTMIYNRELWRFEWAALTTTTMMMMIIKCCCC